MATTPLLKRISTLAAKIETTAGTPISLAAADGTANCYNLSIQPDITVEEREDPGGFNRRKGAPGARGGTVTFTTDIQWDEAAAVPGWASTFLPACGWVVSTLTYTPRSEAFGTNVKTLTIGMYEDGVFKSIAGAQGNFEIVLQSGMVGIINWTFRGVWQAPTDVAIIDPTYVTVGLIRFAGGTSTWDDGGGAVAQSVQQATISSGNEIILREDVTTAAGYKTALIVDRTPTISWNPEAEKIATDDRYGAFIGGTEGPISMTLGTTMTISAPKAQIMNIQGGDRDKLLIDEVEFNCNKNGATKDEELSIVFA